MSLAPTSRQVHEMQSGLASFAFAIARPAGYQGDAFQASSPKNFPGRFWRPLFFVRTQPAQRFRCSELPDVRV